MEDIMEFLDKRVRVICSQLEKLKVKQKFPIEKWLYKEGDFIYPADADREGEWKEFDSTFMHWYGYDRHYWFKTLFEIPESLAEQTLWLYVCTQIDEWDDAKNPQFLLFVDGEPVQGMDMNHREVMLPVKGEAGRKI